MEGLVKEALVKAMMALAAGAVVGGSAGCASTGASEPSAAPTHRWVAQTDVSSAKYNFDNKLCAEQSMVEFHANARHDGHGGDAAQGEGSRQYTIDAPEFAQYQRCMQGKGYDLATY